MSIAALKFLNRNAPRALRTAGHNFIRYTSTDDPCHPKQPEPCPSPPKSTCPEPPPCPPIPPCPPTICPPVFSSADPCNYCPPPCSNPDDPDLIKLKKLQCLYQEKNDIPIYLKKGNSDVILFQASCFLVFTGMMCAFYSIYKTVVNK